jgi:hypothetical protein
MATKIRQDVAIWNNRFPLDRWWRKKNNVSFLSVIHRESSFYSIYFEFYEDLMFKEYKDKADKNEEESLNKVSETYEPLKKGSWWKGKELTSKEIDDWLKSPL